MPVTRVRTGAPVAPTETASGTDGSAVLPRVVAFRWSNEKGTYAIPCIVHNLTGNGNAIRVKWNTDEVSLATEPAYISINDGTATDISMGGLVNIRTVSYYTIDGGDDLDDVHVVGWTP